MEIQRTRRKLKRFQAAAAHRKIDEGQSRQNWNPLGFGLASNAVRSGLDNKTKKGLKPLFLGPSLSRNIHISKSGLPNLNETDNRDNLTPSLGVHPLVLGLWRLFFHLEGDLQFCHTRTTVLARYNRRPALLAETNPRIRRENNLALVNPLQNRLGIDAGSLRDIFQTRSRIVVNIILHLHKIIIDTGIASRAKAELIFRLKQSPALFAIHKSAFHTSPSILPGRHSQGLYR